MTDPSEEQTTGPNHRGKKCIYDGQRAQISHEQCIKNGGVSLEFFNEK